MSSKRYYHALAMFNEAASQMRLALRTFCNLRIFRDLPSYEIDLEVLRTEVSERMMDEIGEEETKKGAVAVQRQRRSREKLRQSDPVLRDRLGKAEASQNRRQEHALTPIGANASRKKPLEKRHSPLNRKARSA